MFPILTLNNLLTYDDSLFNQIVLPLGVDKQLLLDTIARNYGEMHVIYPDWPVMRYCTSSWFASHEKQIADLYRVYIVDYNPIWNKDGTIEETRTPNLTETRTPDLTDERSPDITRGMTYGKISTESGNRTQQYEGFNSSAMQDVSKELPAGVVTDSGSDTGTETGTETVTHTGSDTTKHTGTETTVRRETGNIGLTTTQAMITDEVKLKRTYSFYDLIAKMYASEFCVMIY